MRAVRVSDYGLIDSRLTALPGGVRFRNEYRGFDNEHREEYL
jgi:hypothetical protein